MNRSNLDYCYGEQLEIFQCLHILRLLFAAPPFHFDFSLSDDQPRTGKRVPNAEHST